MALPGPDAADQPWPPWHWDPVAHDQRLWSAWYSGKPDQLAWAYQNLGANSQVGRNFFRTTGEQSIRQPRPGSYRGGLLGSVDRTFWGTTPSAGEKRTKVHIPLATDITTMSADLLFAKRPKFEAEDGDTAVADWCEERFDDDLHSTLHEGADLCAGLGGLYLRTVYDQALSDRPWIELVHADAAVPVFRAGKLTEVTFWRVLVDDGDEVHRHLEHHDIRTNSVYHSVYVGDQQTLGSVVGLRDYPDLQPLFATLDSDNAIRFPDIAPDASTVTYIPNMRPNRYWRHLGHAAALGRSDFAGIEGLMDSLDETFSSWMRDIRLGKMRLMVPPDYLNDLGPGKGALADIEKEVFVPLKMLSGTADSAITANQFAIRWEDHQSTMKQILGDTLRSAGYSGQIFGESTNVAMTATEVEDRDRRTLMTGKRKQQYWRPGLRDALYSLQWIEKSVFKRPITPARPLIMWPEMILPSLSETSTTIVAMNTAQAASKQTMIQLLHPDWTDDQVTEELDRIRDEAAFDILGRARVMLQGPQDSEATIGQEIDEIAGDVQITSDTSVASDPSRELSI
ncbi:MAG TPA: phage portal protein [Trebonia sp.]